MTFKILRTIENGKLKLWIAPSLWENNGVVKWPKSNAQTLCRNEKSMPRPDWRKKNCQVKRTNLPTYEDADLELSRMLEKTDTDDDVDPRFFKNTQPREMEPLNLNSLVQQVMINPEEQSQTIIPNQVVESPQIMITSDNDTYPTYCMINDNTNFSANTYEVYDFKKMIDNQNLLLANQNKMLELIAEKHREQKTILENQEKMLHEIASLSIQVDNIIMMLGNQREIEVCTLEKTRNTPESLSFKLEKINDITELNKMETMLSDKNARERLKRLYSVVCSRGKGLDCAYTLIDVLFSRDFLCQCSWSGSSRNDGIKISLKCYKNVVSFFWEMIFKWDSTFSIKDNEIFFKNILKNANKRKIAKLERTSTSRKRVKQDKNNQKKLDNDNITKNRENETNSANIKENGNFIEITACSVQSNDGNIEDNVTMSITAGDIEIGPDSGSDVD